MSETQIRKDAYQNFLRYAQSLPSWFLAVFTSCTSKNSLNSFVVKNVNGVAVIDVVTP